MKGSSEKGEKRVRNKRGKNRSRKSRKLRNIMQRNVSLLRNLNGKEDQKTKNQRKMDSCGKISMGTTFPSTSLINMEKKRKNKLKGEKSNEGGERWGCGARVRG